MAAPTKALGIDITASSVNMALLKRTRGGVKLLSCGSAPLPKGAVAGGNIADENILCKAIEKVRKDNKIKKAKVNISLFSNPVLLQTLDIPSDGPVNITQFVKDEIKSYAILPMKNIALDYCGIGPSSRSTNNRLLMAAASDHKQLNISRELEKEGYNVSSIEPGPFAYIRACYAKKIEGKAGRNLLFAIVHQDILTLCAYRGGNLDFLRTKELEQEHKDPEKYCSWLADQVITVLKFYELEVPDLKGKWEVTIASTDPDKDIDKYSSHLRSRLEMVELEIRSPADAFTDTPAAGTETASPPSAIAIGLAMKLFQLPGCRMNTNLLPAELKSVKMAKTETKATAFVAVMLVAAMIGIIVLMNQKIKTISDKSEQKKQKQAADAQKVQDLMREQTLLDEKTALYTEYVKAMDAALVNTSYMSWAPLLERISQTIPEAVQITSFVNGQGRKVSIQGLALSYKAIDLFVENLNKSPYFESAVLAQTSKSASQKNMLLYNVNCIITQ
jgi:Tfp pilus assembly protein PilN